MSAKPLSQSSPKKKLYIGIPTIAISLVIYNLGIVPNIAKFIAIAMCAYVIVGLIELALGDSLVSAAKSWDNLAGWKKFLISLLVIIVALVVFISLIPVFAKIT